MAYFIIIRGPLGIGKTTIAKKLAKILKAKYIAIDRVPDEYDLTGDHEDGYISQKSFIRANEIIAPTAEKFLVRKIPVIFDGNFYWKSQIEDLIKRLGGRHFVFTLKAPLKVCIERDQKRKKSHGEDAARVVYAKSTEFDFGIGIDVTGNVGGVIDQIIPAFEITYKVLFDARTF